VLDGGDVLTENAAILQYLASLAPERGLVPADERGRASLRQWLSYIGAELHEAYIPLLDRTAPAEAKAYAQKRLEPRLARVADHLAQRRYLLDDYSIADAYLFAVLNWSQVTPVKLDTWPALTAFMARMLERPAVQRAFGEERELYVAELARTRA
jgi:glutathione S-transferase